MPAIFLIAKRSSAGSAIQDTYSREDRAACYSEVAAETTDSSGVSPSRTLTSTSSHWPRHFARHTVSFPPTYFRATLVVTCVCVCRIAIPRLHGKRVKYLASQSPACLEHRGISVKGASTRRRARDSGKRRCTTSARRHAATPAHARMRRSAAWRGAARAHPAHGAHGAFSPRYSVQVCAPINVATFLIYGRAERRNLAAATFRRCIYLLFAATPANWDGRM